MLGGATTNGRQGNAAETPNSDPQAGTENTAPLPNPWQSSAGSRSSPRPFTATTTTTGSTTAGSTTTTRYVYIYIPCTCHVNIFTVVFIHCIHENMFSSIVFNYENMRVIILSSANASPAALMFQTPGMQSVLDQMTQNPELMQNMMSSPYFQNMMNQMAQNPELISSVRIFYWCRIDF